MRFSAMYHFHRALYQINVDFFFKTKKFSVTILFDWPFFFQLIQKVHIASDLPRNCRLSIDTDDDDENSIIKQQQQQKASRSRK